ncbi:MAG: TonB-dependent receptor [Halieaceae bacterium]|nr:TonB-dependent receptor [Halieaceae bacterium]
MKFTKRLMTFLLSASILPFTQTAISQEALEEVVVTGIRASLVAATELKRNDSRIVDAIVAEDIGKLPDNNIAEALQRITGVSINTDFGVGDSVSIRGLSQNRVELNGRTTIGDDRDGISLQDFPSSFLKSVEVIKSPTADMIEGALGGTVGMNTVRPLELSGLTVAGSLDTEYADKTENWAPIANFSAGNVWDLDSGGRFGVIGMLSYQDRTIRQDEYKNRVRLYDEPVNGLVANTPSGRFAVREQNTLEQYEEDRERTALNLSLQWAPASDAGSVYLDVSMTERSGGQRGSSILDVGGSRTYNANTTQDGSGQVNNYSLTGAFVIPKTWSEFRETESFSNALGFDWNFSDTLAVSGEISMASSESSQPDSEFNLRPINKTNWETWAAQYTPGVSNFNSDRVAFGLRHTVDAEFNQSGSDIPSIVYSDPLALLSPENLAIRRFVTEEVLTTNDETAVRFDVDYSEAFGLEFVSSLKAGIRFTKNDYEFNEREYLASNLYRNVLYDEGTATERPFAVWIDDFEAMFPGSFETVNHSGSFDQHGISGQMDLLEYRIYRGDLLTDLEGTFDRVQEMLKGTNYETTGSLDDNLEVQESAYRDITEETGAFYVSAELDFDNVRAVVGGRYVTTDIESTVYVDGELVTGDHDYSDILPSLNVTYDVTENTLVRFAAAKVMRRANYSELSPAFEINSSFYSAVQGAIDLDPFRATQYDLSIEHYFGEGNLVSFAVFYKDVKSFLSESNTCVASSLTSGQNVTEWEAICLLGSSGVNNPDLEFSTQADFAGAPDVDAAGFAFTAAQRDAGLTGINTNRVTNGENGTIEGFELGYHQHFDFLPGAWSGLGVSANYTYADSEQPNGNMLLDISENTINAQLYWEGESIQVRLAYNFRDRFLDTEEETRVQTVGGLALNSNTNDETSPVFDPTAGNNYRDDRGQFDFSASWAVSDSTTVVANITNLTGEPSTFLTELGSPWYYTEADRRFSLGLRMKF